MNKKLLPALLLLSMFSISSAQKKDSVETYKWLQDTSVYLSPSVVQMKSNQIATLLLQKFHYNKFALDDTMSKSIFDRYIEALDNGKNYFLKSDIENFEKYKYNFDNYLLRNNLAPAFDIFNQFKRRFIDRMNYVKKIISGEFDYSLPDSLETDRKNAPWEAPELNH